MLHGIMFIERFVFKQWESVKEIQYLCGSLDFIRLLDFYKFTVFVYI